MQKNRRGAMSASLGVTLGTVLVLGGLAFLLVRMNATDDDSTANGGANSGKDRGSNGNGPESQQNSSNNRQMLLYCAAGLQKPVKLAMGNYLREHNVQIRTTYAGSGTLLSTLQQAKRGDLFLAADKSYIDLARKAGVLAEAIPLARQKAVIAVKKGNPKNIESIEDLLRSGVRFAIANPEAASIGKLTKKLLTKTGQWAAVRKRAKVTQPTVTEITNSLLLGAVDAAIVWDAIVRQQSGKLEMIEVPVFNEAVMDVTIGVLKTCGNPTAALRFCRYLQAPKKGGEAFAREGYETIEGDPWVEKPTLNFFSGGVNRVAIQETLEEFEIREGVQINVSYNGCGILVGQIRSGSRPDAYFSCDQSFMIQVADLFPNAFPVSETDIVIAVKKGNPKEIETIEDLTKAGLKIGVTNEKQSALGALTVNLLKRLKLYKGVFKNVRVQAPTADLVVTQILIGPLDAAIVYRANLSKVKSKLEIVEIKDKTAKAVQPIAIGKSTKFKYLTQRLVDAITSADSRERFESANFRWRVGNPR